MENTYTYINFNRLLNEDFNGFHKRVSDAASIITLEDVVAIHTAYKANVEKFHEYVANAAVTSAKASARDTDVARTEAFVNFRSAVSQLRKNPNATDAALGEELWTIVKGCNRAHSMTQSALTGAIKDIISDVEVVIAKEAYAAAYAGDGLKAYFDKLVETENAYVAADQARSNNRTERLQDSNLAIREACIKGYTDLVSCARGAVAAKSDANCKEFLNKVADIVKFARSLYITRAGRRAKAKDGNVSSNASSDTTSEVKVDEGSVAETPKDEVIATAETTKVETVTETTNTETIKAVA